MDARLPFLLRVTTAATERSVIPDTRPVPFRAKRAEQPSVLWSPRIGDYGPSALAGITNTPCCRRYAGDRDVMMPVKAGSPTLLVSTFARQRRSEAAAPSTSSGFVRRPHPPDAFAGGRRNEYWAMCALGIASGLGPPGAHLLPRRQGRVLSSAPKAGAARIVGSERTFSYTSRATYSWP